MPVSEGERDKMTDSQQYITFYARGQLFGIDIMETREIVNLKETTEMPNAPEFVEGIVDLRGEIVPVIMLDKRLTLTNNRENSIQENEKRVIIVSLQDNLIGLEVDEVEGIISLNSSNIEEAPELARGINSNFVRGVGKHSDKLVIILNLDKILTIEEMKQIEKTMDLDG